jgi:hypothetical protein
MDTTLLLVAAASLAALPLAGRLLIAVQQGWRPGAGRAAGNAAGGANHLRVVARAQLSPQHSLHLVETAEGTLLVSCSPKGTQVLDRRTQRERSAMIATMGAAR